MGKRCGLWNNKWPFCQICSRPDHIEYKCYNGFDPNFQGLLSNSKPTTNVFYASPDTYCEGTIGRDMNGERMRPLERQVTLLPNLW